VSIDTRQRAPLYENAARFAKDNGVVLGQALTPALQAKLDRPMLWYVEQELPDPNGNVVRALVPTVYLPQLYREQHPNLAGGVIRGEDVTLQAQGAITNTGYLLAGNQLSVSATEFINQKRLGNIGRIEEKVEGGYLVTTGERVVQEGAFVSAAKLQLNAERIASISGEFQVIGKDAQDTQAKSQAYLAALRERLGTNFTESIAKDNLHHEFIADQGLGLEQIAIAAIGIGLSVWLGPQMSQLVGSAVGATAGSGTMMAASATAGSMAGAGLGNVMLSGALTSMSTTALTGALSGELSFENVFKAGLSAGLTAGLTSSLGVSGWGVSGGKISDWGLRTASWATEAAIRSSVSTTIHGSSFGNAFVSNLVTAASADAATLIGDTFEIGTIDASFGTRVAHASAHAALGCVAAAARGADCAGGAHPAAAHADRPAPSVEHQQLDPRRAAGLEHGCLRLPEQPAGGGDAHRLVAAGVADHHHLPVAARGQVLPVHRVGEEPGDDRPRVPQRLDRLEERRDVQRQRAFIPVCKPCPLREQQHREHVVPVLQPITSMNCFIALLTVRIHSLPSRFPNQDGHVCRRALRLPSHRALSPPPARTHIALSHRAGSPGELARTHA
jgi:hypothetical protein